MTRAKRSASAPYPRWSITTMGSIPVPSDLLIRFPSRVSTVGWIYTSVKGTSPLNSSPNMSIRATQRKMMPRSVTRTSPG